MAVKIRLTRIGKKKAPSYRLVAVDGRTKRDGAFLENLGTYDALKGKLVSYHHESVQKWLSYGAIPTESALKLIKLYGKQGATLSSSSAHQSLTDTV